MRDNARLTANEATLRRYAVGVPIIGVAGVPAGVKPGAPTSIRTAVTAGPPRGAAMTAPVTSRTSGPTPGRRRAASARRR